VERSTVLAGARVVTPGGVLPAGVVELRGGLVADVRAGGCPPAGVRLDGGWLLPGFVDLHCHGGGGASFSATDPDELRRAAAACADHGTSAVLASLVTAPVEALCAQLARVADLVEDGGGPVVGAHLEGPFLAAARCGAQDPRWLVPPDVETFVRLHDASRGTLRLLTLAPELPGASALLRAALARGVAVAVGHTAATYEQAQAAFAAGAGVATHLFNAMPPLHHREPGAALAALQSGAVCEVVADGHHLHPAVVRLVADLAPGRAALVTDAVAAAGAPDGPYRLGELDVVVRDGRATLAGTDTLAGSTLTMDAALRRCVTASGVPVERASAMATAVPAGVLGLDTGIAVGRRADLVHLDEQLRLTAVWSAGERR
jgi:N-acetylglucosamine-6-phosphate deacetylase